MQIAGPGETTRLLLSRGARVDVVDSDGWTPLHAAATFLLVDAVQLLLAHGADPRATNKRGYTPLHEALDDGSVRTTRFLWNEAGVRDVFLAAGLGEVDFLLEALQADPALVRTVDGRERTPLHWAARCGQLEATRVLLERSADPEAREERGWTPLHWAAFGYPIQERSHGPVSFEIARLLLQHGAARCPVAQDGRTPLDLLEGSRHWDKPALAELLRGFHD
jgi:ankyrin repeat protein